MSKRGCLELGLFASNVMSEQPSRRRQRQEEEDEGANAAAQQLLDDALSEACLGGIVKEVKAALEKGANVAATNERGQSGLMLACKRSDLDTALPIVKLLLSKKSAVWLCDNSRRFAFCCVKPKCPLERAQCLQMMRHNVTAKRF